MTARPVCLIAALAAALSATAAAGASGASGAAPGRIRYTNERIADAFEWALLRSETFRDLVARVEQSDMTVYIDDGRCPQSARGACLHVLPFASERRIVIYVHTLQVRISIVRQLAHELQHATEIAGSDVVDDGAVRRLYERIGYRNSPSGSDLWETRAAQSAESLVLAEAMHARSADARAGRE